jgi:hypothetical protein
LAVFISGCIRESDPKLRNQTRVLIEKDKIIERVNELFARTDNRDWEQVKRCFTDTVLLDMTSMVGGEPSIVSSQEIVDSWDKGLRALKAVHHQTQSGTPSGWKLHGRNRWK